MNKIDLTKRFCILGLGVSGVSALNFLIENRLSNDEKRKPEKIFLSDKRQFAQLDEEVKHTIQAQKRRLETEFGCDHSNRCLDTDYIVVSPGINFDQPLLLEARKHQIEVITEVELAAEIANANNKDFVGITGTNGKSTVTAWISHLTGYPACGNIGEPFLNLAKHNQHESYICELSSFQLAHSQNIRPKVAAITNITSDHITWHKTWEHYMNSKLKITQNQDETDWLLLPIGEVFNEIETRAKIMWVNSIPQQTAAFTNEIWINQQSEIIFTTDSKDEKITDVSSLPLPGPHNLDNALCSIASAKLIGCSTEQIQSKLQTFRGLEHRLEFVKEAKGKKFFNDSKATNPESAVVALKSFSDGVTWLAGGKDKMTDLSELCQQACKNVKDVILFGEAADRIAKELKLNNYHGEIEFVDSLNEAVDLSLSKTGGTVLLSPACSSFDQFENFEERGEVFKQQVALL